MAHPCPKPRTDARRLLVATASLAVLALACAPAGAKSLDDLRDEGYALADKKDCAHAYPIFLTAASRSGDAPDDHLAAANCAVDMGHPADAIAQFRLALAKRAALSASDRNEALVSLAYQLEDAGQNKAALVAWDDALANSDTAEARIGVVRSAAAAGDKARADQMLATIDPLQLTPALQAEYWSEKAERLAADNPQLALDAINRAIALEDADYRRITRSEIYLKLGRKAEAIADLEAAHKQKPDDAETDAALAYAYDAAGRHSEAAAMFEAASRANPGSKDTLDDWGYALAAAGRNDEAAKKFRLAIDRDTQQKASASPDKQAELDTRLADSRQQVHDLERDFSFSADFIYRSDSTGNVTPLLNGTQFPQSALGAEADWRTPWGLVRPRDLTLFGSAFVGFNGSSLRINGDSLQGAAGIRWQPWAETEFTVSFERLIKLGDTSRDGWDVNAHYSGGEGRSWNVAASSWTYLSLEADAEYVWSDPQFASLSAEGRAGRAYKLGPYWTVIPHIVVAGEILGDNGNGSSLFEAGPGVALAHEFCEDFYQGPLCTMELAVQYRFPIARDGLGRNGGAFVSEISFGL